jgi:hypothetical protein
MSINPLTANPADLDDPVLIEADTAAVFEHLTDGGELDSGVAERVHTRAERVTADIQRDRGVIGDDAFQSLLDDEG